MTALVAGLLVCPIGFAPLPPDGVPVPATGQPCDGLAPLPEALRSRATHHDPDLVYSDGCAFRCVTSPGGRVTEPIGQRCVASSAAREAREPARTIELAHEGEQLHVGHSATAISA